MKLLIFLMLIWNVVTFAMMGIDKHKAKVDGRRISEKTLLISTVIMGAIGICAGAAVFHHKTQKIIFKIALPLGLIINGAVIYGLYCLNII